MKNYTFSIIYILLSVMLIWSTACEDSIITSNETVDNTNFEVNESFAFRLPVTNHAQINIQAISGSITIMTCEDSDSLKIAGKRRVRSESLEDARLHLADLNVSIVERNQTIYISTEQPNESYGRTYLVDYVLEVPVDCQLQLDQINGDIEIDAIQADIRATLTNRNIVLNYVSGCVNADRVNGIIKAKVVLPDSGQCFLNNVNGQILLFIPYTSSADFYASVVNGIVSVQNLVLSNLVSSPNQIRGILGAGTGDIRCNLVNGQIVVSGVDY